MKTKTKALLLALCGVLLIVGTVFTTVAFLTSTTDVVKNTFTVGNVTITLDEEDVDDSTPDKDRDVENEYHLVPGGEYEKDPTIHVQANSEDCYLFIKVKNDIASVEDSSSTIESQILANDWVVLSQENDGSVIYYLSEKVESSEDVQDVYIFAGFKVSDDVSNETLADLVETEPSITVVAYAIQSTGFDSAEEAWAAAPSTWTK